MSHTAEQIAGHFYGGPERMARLRELGIEDEDIIATLQAGASNRTVKHPDVFQVPVTVYESRFECTDCEGQFLASGARVSETGELICTPCSGKRYGHGGGYDYCPECGQTKPVDEFAVHEPYHRKFDSRTPCHACQVAAMKPAGPKTNTCAQCGGEFESKRSDAKFCSGKCRVAAHRAAQA